MYRTNISFLREQLEKIVSLKIPEIKIEEVVFNIEFDALEKQEAKTNFDEIMTFWVIPKILGKDLSVEEVCETLVTGKNEIPLWIKLDIVDDNKIKLQISKRFRKKKIIEEWHNENEYEPFIL